jgi:ABC-2 type transport system permease protein
MSTITGTLSPPGNAAHRPARDVQPVTQARVMGSEWIKLRTLRSSWIVLGATFFGVALIGMLVSYFTKTHWSSMNPVDRANFDPVGRSLIGVNLAQLTIGVLGVLIITGEYSTGMIRASLGAVPKRVPVLVAKASVFAAVTFVVCLVTVFVAFVGGQALLGSHGVSLGHAGAVRAVFGAALYLTIVGVIGLSLGFLIRSTAGGIAALFGVLLILPVIFEALPQSWNNTVGPYLPSNAGQALYTLHADHAMLSPWAGLGIFLLYAVAAVTAAVVVLRRRDA